MLHHSHRHRRHHLHHHFPSLSLSHDDCGEGDVGTVDGVRGDEDYGVSDGLKGDDYDAMDYHQIRVNYCDL